MGTARSDEWRYVAYDGSGAGMGLQMIGMGRDRHWA